MAVGTINVVRGVVGVASGALTVTEGTATAPVLGMGAPAIPVGTARIALGLASISRGSQQISESLSASSGPTAKNLLGLLPFGQEYDDAAEPGPIEYFKQRYREFVTDPIATGKQLLKDLFAIDGGTQ